MLMTFDGVCLISAFKSTKTKQPFYKLDFHHKMDKLTTTHLSKIFEENSLKIDLSQQKEFTMLFIPKEK